MTVMQGEAFQALRAIDIPEEKAIRAAGALSRCDEDVSSPRSDMALMKWMMGFVLAFQVGILVKLFIH